MKICNTSEEIEQLFYENFISDLDENIEWVEFYFQTNIETIKKDPKKFYNMEQVGAKEKTIIHTNKLHKVGLF